MKSNVLRINFPWMALCALIVSVFSLTVNVWNARYSTSNTQSSNSTKIYSIMLIKQLLQLMLVHQREVYMLELIKVKAKLEHNIKYSIKQAIVVLGSLRQAH